MKTKKEWYEVADEFKEQYPEEFKTFVEQTRAEGGLSAMKKDMIFDTVGLGIVFGTYAVISIIIHNMTKR